MPNIQVGKVLKLFISTSKSSQRYDRASIVLESNGVVDDKFYGKDPARSILLTSMDSYDLIKSYDIDIPYGYLGENLLIDFNPYSLSMGTQLKIGNTILEISQSCTICNHLSVIDTRIPKLLKDNRGIFAKTIQNGEIRLGDTIYLL
jgi:MOSC domain-containing protein YiiM